jgi:Co/Zn/Cd efflux system component
VVSTLAGGRKTLYTPVVLAGVCFLLFAPIEIVASFIVHNSAIAGNAFHDAFDGVFFIVFGYYDRRMLLSPEHRIFCTRRGRFGIVTACLAVLFVAAGLTFVQSDNTSFHQMAAGIVIGPVSFFLNFYWERRLSSHADHKHNGFSVHLLGDMAGSVIAGTSGILAFASGFAIWNTFGGYAIFASTLAIAAPKSIKLWRSISHTEDQHHDHEHTGHQH